MRALLAISAWFLAVLYLGLENLYDLSKAELAEKKRYNHSFHTFFMNTYLHVVTYLFCTLLKEAVKIKIWMENCLYFK